MSLEKAILALTEAMIINNGLLEQNLATRAEAVKKIDTVKTTTKKRVEEEEDELEPRKSKSKSIEEVVEEKRKEKAKKSDKKAKAPSEEDIRKAFGGFMSVEDEDDRADRKTFVKAILNELGVAKATDIEANDRAKAINWLELKAAGKKVDFDSEEEAEEEDDLI